MFYLCFCKITQMITQKVYLLLENPDQSNNLRIIFEILFPSLIFHICSNAILIVIVVLLVLSRQSYNWIVKLSFSYCKSCYFANQVKIKVISPLINHIQFFLLLLLLRLTLFQQPFLSQVYLPYCNHISITLTL